MNLRKCYIENFGKLHQFKYEFSDGINIINQLNGWGKSTFATFIKAMFFGFENSNKRSILENERKKYYPWQGGKFGGNLEFEIDGKIYEIERFFGAKEKEDTFKLYNKITNCECNDFSENIGEEIFKIDRAGYERSTYIPQQAISIEINDSLSAKLSNILENENDIDSSDEAINRILSVMKEYKKIGNKGKINELETKINDKKRELENAQKNEELINERIKKIEEIKSQIKKYEENKNENQEKVNNYFLIYNEIEKLKSDLMLLNEKKESQEKIEKIEAENIKRKNRRIIISIIIILLGILLGIFLSKYLFTITGIGIILLIIDISLKNKKGNKKIKNNFKSELISEINDKNIRLEELNNELKNNIENKDSILEENEILTKNINELINQKSYDENEMNRLINTSITTEDLENEIENLEQELSEINKKYNILDKTQKYLIKAKEQFSTHYLKGMVEGFEKYLNIINDEKIDTNIDVKLNVKVQEYGEKKEIDYLSTGYKDLIGICMRFALIDALFESEKPFIILDDPFVNLDKEKIKRAKEIVEELSKKYQVIYFVCHDSRE